ncbi:MAG: carbohydrate ABC transporter permease [Treponema sp.]|nr:carbohydrate ABC transporter permease [Treponema sp.]
MKIKIHGFDIFNYILLGILTLLFLYPFWYTLVMSFSTPVQANSLGLRFFPWPIDLSAYNEAFASTQIWIGFANTLFRVIVGTVLGILITYAAAYALSRKNLPFKRFLTTIVIFTMFFSGGLIPFYLLVQTLHLTENRWSLILPFLVQAFYLIITRNFVMSIPDEMEESAMVDGATPFTVMVRIMIPLSKPILAVLTLWIAVYYWNEWFYAYIFVHDSSKEVLQLYLYNLLVNNTTVSAGGEGSVNILQDMRSHATPQSIKAATVVLSVIPIMAVYPFIQKYFVKGIMAGALKG